MSDLIDRAEAISRAVELRMYGKPVKMVEVSELERLPSVRAEHDENSPSEQPQMNELGVKTGETCADTISRQEAIRIASGYCHPANIAKELAKLPPAQSKPQWIPCSERLPTEGESVLLCDRCGDITLGRLVRTNEGCKWDIYAWWNDIDDWNAWRELPEPYKERREE